MRVLILIVMAVLLSSCADWKIGSQKPTKTWAETTGMGISHDAAIENPPEAHQEKKEEKSVIPPGSIVTKTETAATETTPATIVTVFALPKDKGMDMSVVNTKTDLVGSKGFAPPKAATPLQKATAAWTYVGIGICALGIFFCTPWGGSNYRVGGLIAAGGIGMSIVGKFIDQINVPAPAMGLIFVVFALAMYYGYRVRHKQAEAPTTQ